MTEIDFSMFNPDILDEYVDDPNNKVEHPEIIEDPEKDDPIDGPAPGPEPGVQDDPIEDEEDETDDDSEKNIKFVYNNIAKLLKEEGMFDDKVNLEEIENSDNLVEALRGEIKKNELSDLSETQKSYLEAIRKGVPDDVFLQNEQAMQNYSSITNTMLADNESLRKDIILADLESKGVSKERAGKLVDSLVAAGEDITEASESLTNLKKDQLSKYQSQLDAIEKQKADNTKQDKKRFNDLKDSVYETKEIIKNYKITDNLRDKVYATMTKAVSESEDGTPINKFTSEREKDPIGFDTTLYYLFEMTKGFKDFSIFEKKAQSKAARELEKVVSKTNILNTSSSSSIIDDDESLDIPSIVELSDD